MWSLDYLRDRRRQAPVAFSFQYQNQIVQTSELSLSPDLIVRGGIATEFDAMGIGVDLSAGVREQNDFTVFVMGGRIGNKIHVIDCKRLRIMGNLEKLEALMEMMEEWGVVHKDGTNYFNAKNKLPEFYWTGNTEMNCMKNSIGQTVKEAYAHHIQRLMITGNYALIAGIKPKEDCEWYLSVYADAYEWVELPNTHGMTLYADGGILGSKPYAASGNYINKMSNYCKDCQYDVKKKEGKDACPFNYLYWNFFLTNQKNRVILLEAPLN